MNGPLYHKLRLQEKERNGDTRTGCHCAVKPPGCAGKPGQEQQLTHTQLTKNDTHSFSHSLQLERSAVPYQHTFHVQIHVSCNCLSSYPHALCSSFCCASAWRGSCSTGASLKPHVVLAFRLLISCDRCIPPGGVEFELFIKPHESIKSHGAVGHKHMRALYPYVESRQERSQRQY